MENKRYYTLFTDWPKSNTVDFSFDHKAALNLIGTLSVANRAVYSEISGKMSFHGVYPEFF